MTWIVEYADTYRVFSVYVKYLNEPHGAPHNDPVGAHVCDGPTGSGEGDVANGEGRLRLT